MNLLINNSIAILNTSDIPNYIGFIKSNPDITGIHIETQISPEELESLISTGRLMDIKFFKGFKFKMRHLIVLGDYIEESYGYSKTIDLSEVEGFEEPDLEYLEYIILESNSVDTTDIIIPMELSKRYEYRPIVDYIYPKISRIKYSYPEYPLYHHDYLCPMC